MGIYCVLWVVIQCYFSFVAQTVPVLVTGSSFNWLPCPFDIWHTPITVCVCVCVSGGRYVFYLLGDFWCQLSDVAETQNDPTPLFHSPQPLATMPLTMRGLGVAGQTELGTCPFLPPQSLPCRNNALSPGWVCLPVLAPEKLGDHSDVIAFLSVRE